MDQYKREGGGKYKSNLEDLKIKFADFTYKGSFETDETDLTQKKILADLLRAGKAIFSQFSMGIDSDIEEVIKKSKANPKDPKALGAALSDAAGQIRKDMKAENDAAHKRLRSLMAEILKEHSAAKEGVDFANEAQVGKYIKSLKSLHDLRRDYRVFRTALLAASSDAKPDSQASLLGKAYEKFMESDGVHLVEAGRKIPKVSAVKVDSKADATQKKQAESINTMSAALDLLRKGMADVSDELEAVGHAYVKLQEMLARAGSGGSGGTADPVAQKKEQALITKSFDQFPEISEAAIKKVIESLEKAEDGLAQFKKST